jgi:preprotein translocase subunit Sec63
METITITLSSPLRPDQEVMQLANLRMEKWQALQMHRLIHQAGVRQLSSEEQKILDTLLEIHNEIALRKARGIAEAIHRGLAAVKK